MPRYERPVCRNAKHPVDMSVKGNFTFDLTFLVHEDLEKNIGFHFFFVRNLKWQLSKNDQ